MPPWYVLVSAARYLKVPPWELRKQPIRYVQMAYLASRAEHDAAETKANLARLSRGVGAGG